MSAYTWTLSDHSPSITLMSANTWPLSYHSPSTNRLCSRSSARRWRQSHDFSSSPSWARSASPIWRRNCRNSQRLWATMSDSAFRISRLVTVSRATWDSAHWHLSLGIFNFFACWTTFPSTGSLSHGCVWLPKFSFYELIHYWLFVCFG